MCVCVGGGIVAWGLADEHMARRAPTPGPRCCRHNYVMPKSFLELLAAFLRLLADKRAQVTAAKKRLESGLGKLTSTAAQVEDMQRELTELQPVLAATARDVEAMMLTIAHDKEEAASTKQAVEQQEREANEQAATAKAIAGAQRWGCGRACCRSSNSAAAAS